MNGARDFADDDLPAGELDARTAALQASVDAVARLRCVICSERLCGHEALLAVVLGSRNAPRCARCAATETHESAAQLAERARQWIVRRDCFAHVWQRASEAEGFGGTDRPPCLVRPHGEAPTGASAAGVAPPHEVPVATWDAGELGCGELVLELRTRLRALPTESVFRLVARDPAAPVDIPAWCGLVGHSLLSADHPTYLIRTKRG